MFGDPSYPSYRVFLAVFLAAVVTMVLMPFFIRLMRREHVGQQVRADGPGTHLVKQGTPTMGGIVILIGALVATALQAKWTPDLVLAVAATLLTGSLGLLDDIESVAHARSLGLTPSQKMAGLILISVAFCLCAVNMCNISPFVEFPGGFAVNLGVLTSQLDIAGHHIFVPWLYMLFVFLLMAGLSNAVNLTDGLDGLAGHVIGKGKDGVHHTTLPVAHGRGIVDGLHRQYRVVGHGNHVALDILQTGNKGILLYHLTLLFANAHIVAHQERTHIGNDNTTYQVADGGGRAQREQGGNKDTHTLEDD